MIERHPGRLTSMKNALGDGVRTLQIVDEWSERPQRVRKRAYFKLVPISLSLRVWARRSRTNT